MPNILVADSLSKEGLEVFQQTPGFKVDYKPEIQLDELKQIIGNYEGLVIRSRAQVPAEALERPGKLKVIGRAGVGVDNVDVSAATAKGVIVMNTPGGNTISTAENTLSLLLCLARSVHKADATMKAGKWEKKSIKGVELAGKVVGVIGLGRIGMEVAKRCAAFDMEVIGFDPFTSKDVAARMGIELVDLDTIWARADFITVHTPLNDETRGLIGREQIARMKPTVRLINCARGGIIDEEALLEALKDGRIAGAALDVFTVEPLPADHPFRKFDNLVLMPHLSASTAEAQEKVAVDIARQIVECLTGRPVRNAVNAPSLDPEALEAARPFLDLAERLGKFLAQYVAGPIERFSIKYCGSVLEHPTQAISTAAQVGYLSAQSEPGQINYVNAPFLMKQRGVEVIESRSSELFAYANLITLEAHRPGGDKVAVSGTLFTRSTPRIVMLNDKHLDAWPKGTIIVIENKDVPGVIGAVGTTLGNHGVNIAQMTWGRSAPGGDAITILNCDQAIDPAVLKALSALNFVQAVRVIRL